MDIQKYADYFHDGLVFDMRQKKNIILSLESAELWPEWNKDNITLSKASTLSGNLHLEGVKSIYINEKKYDKLEMIHDIGEIYHLKIIENTMVLAASWSNDPPKLPEETDVYTYKIEAEKIYWENIPTAYDEFWDSLDQKTD